MNPSSEFFPAARVGPYEIASRLGRGFVSEVWLAYRPAGDGRMQAMALKRIHHPDPALQHSFREAILRAELLDHPNIVHVFTSFEHDQRTLAVLELIDGMSVKELIDDRARREAKVEPKLAVWIARECLRAAYDVQSQVTGTGTEHGFLGSSNVLLSRDGVVKLSDFILARTTNDPRLVGDLARTPERDAVSIARILLGLWLGRALEELPVSDLERTAESLGRASITAFVRRCLAEDSASQLRALEEDLGRIFYAELGARELSDGTPAVSHLVRDLMPAIEEERARLDESGFKPLVREDESAAPTIATKASFGLTDMLAARDELVVPSPLTAQDIPTGFTRDVSVDSGALGVSSGAVLAIKPATSTTGLSEASTDEDLPTAPPSPPGRPRPIIDLRPPVAPNSANKNPPPGVPSVSVPGHVSATVSSELQLTWSWMHRYVPLVLAFSAGVFLTAMAALHLVAPTAPAAELIPASRTIAPASLEPPVEAVVHPVAAEPAAPSAVEDRARALRARLEGSKLDPKTRRRVAELIDEAVRTQDLAPLLEAERLSSPRRPAKLPPVEPI